MFKINDYIMYGLTGVCKVTDIVKIKNRDRDEKDYYVLNSVYCNDTIIKIPVDNQKVMMRPLISKEEVMSLIRDIPNREITWINDERERNSEFKSLLKSGDCNKWVTLVRSIYLKGKERKAEGKKLNQADENIMKAAEKLLNEEIGKALGILPEEVPKYIESTLK